MTNLLLNLCNGCLKSGLLQGLGFLVRIDLLLSNEVVQGFALVLSDDGVDLGSRVLFNKQSIVSILNHKISEIESHELERLWNVPAS